MMHNKYGDEREEGQAEDDDEEEKILPDFQEGDRYGLFFSASKKVRGIYFCFCYLYQTVVRIVNLIDMIIFSKLA